jgi:hypothetical protein
VFTFPRCLAALAFAPAQPAPRLEAGRLSLRLPSALCCPGPSFHDCACRRPTLCRAVAFKNRGFEGSGSAATDLSASAPEAGNGAAPDAAAGPVPGAEAPAPAAPTLQRNEAISILAEAMTVATGGQAKVGLWETCGAAASEGPAGTPSTGCVKSSVGGLAAARRAAFAACARLCLQVPRPRCSLAGLAAGRRRPNPGQPEGSHRHSHRGGHPSAGVGPLAAAGRARGCRHGAPRRRARPRPAGADAVQVMDGGHTNQLSCNCACPLSLKGGAGLFYSVFMQRESSGGRARGPRGRAQRRRRNAPAAGASAAGA